MQTTILSVDDSKAVRMIVKKAFRTYDVEITEAANGAEGLEAAARVKPQIILLDVTMPVMDGVEMLTKLKSDSSLKGIPVIMLTAEAGKENVLKIAKIGVRDYIVKPFKEEALIDKVSRVVELKPKSDESAEKKSLDDPLDILVVEDKPAIIKQVTEGLAHTKWRIHGVPDEAKAEEICGQKTPDCIIISLSLADKAAFRLYRAFRSNAKTKYTPIFGLCVKTAEDEQKEAQQLGFTSMVTKPIDFNELEMKVARSLNLDTSARYFKTEDDHLLVRLAGTPSTAVVNEVSGQFKQKVSEAVDNGLGKVIVDVHALEEVSMAVIKLLVQGMEICDELGLKHALVGNDTVIGECRGFEESRNWKWFSSLEEARGGAAAPA